MSAVWIERKARAPLGVRADAAKVSGKAYGVVLAPRSKMADAPTPPKSGCTKPTLKPTRSALPPISMPLMSAAYCVLLSTTVPGPAKAVLLGDKSILPYTVKGDVCRWPYAFMSMAILTDAVAAFGSTLKSASVI